MKKALNFIQKSIFLIAVIFASLAILFVNLKINFFRYNNFDYGKFDLGNMTQMVWNASQGNGLWLTDYFGTNLPRWAMSHVDPILYIFVPIFMIFTHPMTLVVSQLILVIGASLIIYFYAKMKLNSDFAAFLLALAYLLNPSIGYLTAWSGFHGVTAVIPFFLGAIYLFEKMYAQNTFSKKNLILFWLLLILTMMGKEQVPLYTLFFGFFIIVVRNQTYESVKAMLRSRSGKLGLTVMAVSILWFIMAFFVVIPAYASYRAEGYKKFAELIGFNESNARDVALDNYFLNRYEEFGDSYLEVGINIIAHPQKSIRVFFGGDRPENFRRTFEPLAFTPFLFPATLLMAVPDLVINYMTTAGGIGTSEILNHRISMIIPVLFISSILGIAYLSNVLGSQVRTSDSAGKNSIKGKNTLIRQPHKFKQLNLNSPRAISTLIALIIFGFTIYTSHYYNNPVYLWISSAVKKRVIPSVSAKFDNSLVNKDFDVGEVVRLTELEDKDRECALKIVKLIPDGASVSGPDPLGAHLSMRETYAIFPALYNEADYVIVDVFARKLLTILDLDAEFIRDVVANLMKDENYVLKMGCGNFFVFENVGLHDKEVLLPMQVKFEYTPAPGMTPLEFFQGVQVVDYEIPQEVTVGKRNKLKVVYYRTGDGSTKDTSLEEYLMFTSFVNKKTGEIYQQANLPSFALRQPEEWVKNRYYVENVEFVLHDFIEEGDYMVFIGMGNKIRTRSIYLGNITVE